MEAPEEEVELEKPEDSRCSTIDEEKPEGDDDFLSRRSFAELESIEPTEDDCFPDFDQEDPIFGILPDFGLGEPDLEENSLFPSLF